MRTSRITLVGGPHCGTEYHVDSTVAGISYQGTHYVRTLRKDPENRQVFHVSHPNTHAKSHAS